MKRYRCIESFWVPKYDEYFYETDEIAWVRKGEIFTLKESGSTYLSADIHLDKEDGFWLEIAKERLDEFFEEIID